MPQATVQAAAAYRQAVVDDVGDWIDQYVIAETIYDAIYDQFGVLPTAEHCRDAWLRTLSILTQEIRTSAKAIDIDPDDV